MKKMFLIAAFATAISTQAFSQASFGIQVGGNLGFLQTEIDNFDDLTNKPRIGILGGFVGEIPMGPVSFRPELNFIQKGGKNLTTETVLGTKYESEEKTRLNYVELPLNFIYNVGGKDGKFFFGLGPNFALGLSGKQEYEDKATIGGVTTTERSKNDVKFSGDNADPGTEYFKRFDFGGNILAGFRLGMGLTANVGFTLGLSDISRNVSGLGVLDDVTRKNHGFTLKLGYMFGGNNSGSTSTPASSSSSNMGSITF